MANLRLTGKKPQILTASVNSVFGLKDTAFKQLAFVLTAVPLIACAKEVNPTIIPLAGTWRFALDQADVGIEQKWFNNKLPERIRLPGILQAQGYGNEISTNTPWVLTLYDTNWFLRHEYAPYTKPGSVKVPFLCQPPRHYIGPAWYQRDIHIPPNWADRRVVLFLERVNWETRVWLNDQLIGSNNSLCTPHEFDLGILPTGKHRLTIRVDNRLQLPYRPDAHSVSDSLGQSWNGIVGRIELRSTPIVWIEDVRVFPSFEKKVVRVQVELGSKTTHPVSNILEMWFTPCTTFTNSDHHVLEVLTTSRWTTVETELQSICPIRGWSEFDPELFKLTVTKRSRGQPDATSFDQKQIVFGFRDFYAVTNTLVLNGRLIYLRGTHHGGDSPLTGYPPCDVHYWRKVFTTCKDWGLNHVRFHSFCPPEAAFIAADELGIYLQIEPGMWNTFNPGSPIEEMLYIETERINKYYGNHPSFMLFSPSNEPKGQWRNVLPNWATYFRARDQRRLYTTGTGFTDRDAPGPLDQVDYCVTARFGQRRVRGVSGWFGRGYVNAVQNVTVPVIVHELGQWCAYPNFDVMKKFTGYLNPGNFEIFRSTAAANNILAFNKQFAWASGKAQLACYKQEIEANLLTPGLTGFQLLDLHDYIGQGTALVGVLDPFWEPKDYVTAAQWRKFCNETVPLARLTKRVFTTAETLKAEIDVAHYGQLPLTNAIVVWQVIDSSGQQIVNGQFAPTTISIGKNVAVGKIELELAQLPAPAAYTLSVSVHPTYTPQAGRNSPATLRQKNRPHSKLVPKEAEQTALPSTIHSATQSFLSTSPYAKPQFTAENDWHFWVYPATNNYSVPENILITQSWDEAETRLTAGGKVLFVPAPTALHWFSPPLAEVPIFWNRQMNPQWSRMLGLWCDTNHPAFANFPTAPHYDWQWTELVRNTRAINIGALPLRLKPIVAAIDDWNRNWRLALIFEAKVARGKLLVCAFDIVSDLQTRPVARQLRRSLLDYMASTKFAPLIPVSPEQMRALLFDTLIMRKLGATAQAPGFNPNAVIDGNPNTFWLTTNHTPELIITFPHPVTMTGLVLMNRQNDRNHAGDIRTYKIELSNDGHSWQPIVDGDLASTWEPQIVKFSKTVTTRYLKLSRLSGFGNDNSTALAELAILYAGPKLAETTPQKIEYLQPTPSSIDIDESTAPLPVN